MGDRIRWPSIVERARQIVEGYEGGVTLRQVMYRLVSEGLLPNTPPITAGPETGRATGGQGGQRVSRHGFAAARWTGSRR
jgi:hypothetical protein